MARAYFGAHGFGIAATGALKEIRKFWAFNLLNRLLHETAWGRDELFANKTMAYNFLDLLNSQKPNWRRTIEFCRHEGTLDGDRIEAWVRAVVGLVGFATTVDKSRLNEFLIEQGLLRDEGEPSCSIADIFRAVGMPGSAAYYEKWLSNAPTTPS
jgi:hypothetical protein